MARSTRSVHSTPADRRGWWRLLPAVIWMLMIFGLSEQTRLVTPLDASTGDLPAAASADRRSDAADVAASDSRAQDDSSGPPWRLMETVGHFFLFASLAILLYWGMPVGDDARRQRLALALIVASLYGAADEMHQRFVPNRGATFYDFGIDVIGAASGLLAVWLIGVYRRKRSAES